MKQIAIFIFFLFIIEQVICQQTKQKIFNLKASTGLASYKINDRLLNYYNYSGLSFLPINIVGEYIYAKNLFVMDLYNNKSKLTPQDIQTAYYTENYIKQWDAHLKIEYYRNILVMDKNIEIYAGISNNSNVSSQEEYYSNLLFEYAKGYRKTYRLSLLDISTNVLINIRYNKSFLRLKSGYSLINYSARPDDNFVKQFGIQDASIWKFSTPENHVGLEFSIFYQLNSWEKTGITAEYNFLYNSFYSPISLRYLKMLFLIGINKTF